MPAVPPTSATRAIAALLDRTFLLCSAIVTTLPNRPVAVVAIG